MYALLALVVLVAQPDTPLLLEGKTRYASEHECEVKLEPTKAALEQYFKAMGGADVKTKCVLTGQHDI